MEPSPHRRRLTDLVAGAFELTPQARGFLYLVEGDPATVKWRTGLHHTPRPLPLPSLPKDQSLFAYPSPKFSTLIGPSKHANSVSWLNLEMNKSQEGLDLKDRISRLMRDMNWDQTKVAEVAQVTKSAVSQWLGGGNKIIHTIGNMEAAERLEQATGFCALWLAKGAGPERVTQANFEIASRAGWPFPKINRARFDALTDEQKNEIQIVMRREIERCEEETNAKRGRVRGT